VYDDPIASSLSPVRLHVLRRLLDGASAKAVAEMLGLSVGNVRNRIAELQAAFGVKSMQELLVAVRSRGIGAPSWKPA
jgi:DNA-binding NarL/FixJ family response regulator